MELYQLRRAREQKGWPQSRVAEALGVTTRTVSRWEQGQALPYPYYRQQLSLLFEKNEQQLGFVPDATSGNACEEHDAQLSPCSPALPQGTFLRDPTIPNGLRRFRNVFGRDHVLAHIRKRLLSTGEQRFTALHGLPGAGKTALAVAFATDPDLCAHFSDGVLWAGLGPQANPLGHLARWGKLLGTTPGDAEQMSVTAWRPALSSAIGSRRFFIVIDDAWNLEDALMLTVGGPNSTYLLTSRLPQVAFAFAHKGALEIPELKEEDALTLVAHYVPQVVQQRHDDMLALIRAVGALPLALTLMGQYLASQALSGQPRRLNTALDYLHDANQRLHLHAPVALDARSPSLPENMPLSLYAAITLSVQQLDPQSQEMLAALAIFPPKPNSFSEEAALAVAQAPVEALDALWDAGLLESSGAGRYTQHQTIVEYARAQGSHPHARQRLVHYILELSQQQNPDRNALEYETANVLVALDAAIELDVHQSLLQGLAQFVPFMQVQGLEVVQRLDSTLLMSQTLVQWGNIHLQQHLFNAAQCAFREALKLNERSDNDPTISALAQDGLAQLSQLRGDTKEDILSAKLEQRQGMPSQPFK